MNRWLDVEHGRNHLITGHWGISLKSAREITNDDNDSKGTFSTSQWMWTSELRSNICEIIWSEVIGVNLLLEARRPAIEACMFQGTNLFLILIPKWCAKVYREILIEGGPWCIPHHRHETKTWKWCKMVEMMNMNWHRNGKMYYCKWLVFKWNFPWTLWGMTQDLATLTWLIWEMDQNIVQW